jgi:hypothetical protein
MAGERPDTMAGADISREPLFMTQRRRMIESYKAAGEPFSASTKPYKSTVSFFYTTVNYIPAASTAWMIAGTGQNLDYFGYKIGDNVPGNNVPAPGYRSATEGDTNLSKARTTNGAEDFVIEGMSASHSSTRLNFGIGLGISPPNITDQDGVGGALGALIPMVDPASLYAPPQVFTPFNLEDAIYRALAPNIALEFQWDRGKIVKIGTLEQIPEGAANSYLRSSGEPSTNDRYRIPEGYLWRREGQPDSEFIVRGTLTQPVAIPILAVLGPSATTPFNVLPGYTVLDCVMRLHGLSVKLPTRN